MTEMEEYNEADAKAIARENAERVFPRLAALRQA